MLDGISRTSLLRLPIYRGYLKSLKADESENVSAKAIATALNMGEVQVRKDLALISSSGRPKIGYNILSLINELETFLGYNNANDAVLVGAGKLGRALLDYEGFQDYGLNIVAAFDTDVSVVGITNEKKSILPLIKFGDFCERLNIKLGIITVPAAGAQAVCDLMIRNGILAIWNFAPVHLVVPSNILVQNENMGSSLAMLSAHLSEQLKPIK